MELIWLFAMWVVVLFRQWPPDICSLCEHVGAKESLQISSLEKDLIN